jgi:uroporphyrinogen-III decarboxylase
MNSRFLDACRRRPTDVRPVWFMRQAGRYMKSYRDIRSTHGLLDICKRPDIAAQVTLQPIEALDVDAAIIFADLLLPVEPMGLKLRFATGEGPVIDNPIRIQRHTAFDFEHGRAVSWARRFNSSSRRSPTRARDRLWARRSPWRAT